MSDMFCFQCEQTAKSSACIGKAGVCGKQADTAGLQDELTGALVGLARAAQVNKPNAIMLICKLMAPEGGLFSRIKQSANKMNAKAKCE